jgi:hypothetical protein
MKMTALSKSGVQTHFWWEGDSIFAARRAKK